MISRQSTLHMCRESCEGRSYGGYIVVIDYCTRCIEAMFDLRNVVHLQQIIATEFNVSHCYAVLEEINRELWCSVCIGFNSSL